MVPILTKGVQQEINPDSQMKNMSTQPIKPHEEFLALVPRLSRSDFELLKRSIEKYGQYLSIVVNSEGADRSTYQIQGVQ